MHSNAPNFCLTGFSFSGIHALVTVRLVQCKRCMYTWPTRIEPKRCAKCRSPYWDTERRNGDRPAKAVREVARVPVARRGANTTKPIARPLARVESAAKSSKTCKHGTEKGYHCWQCGGLAVIE